jgi:hypothetical protein
MILAFSKGINYLYLSAASLRNASVSLLSVRPVLVTFLLALAVNIVTWIFVGSISRLLTDNLAILHYNVTFGIDRIGNASDLYGIALVGLSLIVLNFIIAIIIGHKRERFLSIILMAMTTLVNLFLLLALYLIYLVNFS